MISQLSFTLPHCVSMISSLNVLKSHYQHVPSEHMLKVYNSPTCLVASVQMLGPCRPRHSQHIVAHPVYTRCNLPHIVLFSQRARKLGSWGSGVGEVIQRGLPRANLFSLRGFRLPRTRWGQTVRSSLMATENAKDEDGRGMWNWWRGTESQVEGIRKTADSLKVLKVCKWSLKEDFWCYLCLFFINCDLIGI